MDVIDISVGVDADVVVWPGDPRPSLSPHLSISAGDPANVTHLSMGVHTATHVDAPSHFLDRGATLDSLHLPTCVGPASVVDMRGVARIGPADLERRVPADCESRLLLKTDNSSLWASAGGAFVEDYAALTADGAAWLVDAGCKLIGIDYLSIQLFDDPPDTHVALLRANVVILEGLDLSSVDAGTYTLVCLPLKLLRCEGAPTRAVLLEKDT